MTCDQNWYGDECNTHCIPQQDYYGEGHYNCSDTGQIICHPGNQILGTFRGLRFTAGEPLTDGNIPVDECMMLAATPPQNVGCER